MSSQFTFTFVPDFDEQERYSSNPSLQMPEVVYTFRADVDSTSVDEIKLHFNSWLTALGYLPDQD